ncbi:DUF4333 domain-containing protein [Nocardiopsis sp. ARC36]
MRQTRRQRVVTGAVLGALPLLMATGCSFSFGGPGAVDAEEVAQRSGEMLAEEVGQTPDDLTCSDDLPAEVGAEIRCELTNGGETVGVTVTTTAVDGSDVRWDVQVDEQAADDASVEDETAEETPAAGASGGAVDAAQVAQRSSEMLAEQVGHAPEDFSCSQDLPAEVGAEIRCNLVDGGTNYGVTVTTTAVEGTDVQWDIQVDDAPL